VPRRAGATISLVGVTISSAFSVHNAKRSVALVFFAKASFCDAAAGLYGPEPKDELPV
jgi:hypothetical protein